MRLGAAPWLATAVLVAGCASVPAEYRGPGVAGHAPEVLPRGDRPVVALVLGSGGKRGFAHVGVLKVLAQEGIKPDLVVGTSVGAIVGVLYAAGLSPEELHGAAEEFDPRMLSEPVIGGRYIVGKGFFSSERIQRFVNQRVGNRPIETLPIPFAAVATDAQSGEVMVFNRGDAGMAARASATQPVLFEPVRIEGRDYVDGGLVSPVPVAVARRLGADRVIAVNVAFAPEEMPLNHPLDMAWQTMQIMGATLIRMQRQEADLLIEPELRGLSDWSAFDRRLVIERGEEAARAALPRIRSLLTKERMKEGEAR